MLLCYEKSFTCETETDMFSVLSDVETEQTDENKFFFCYVKSAFFDNVQLRRTFLVFMRQKTNPKS